MNKNHDINTLPKWARLHIASLQLQLAKAREPLPPWFKPGNSWQCWRFPRKEGSKQKRITTLFVLHEDMADGFCQVGENDHVIILRNAEK